MFLIVEMAAAAAVLFWTAALLRTTSRRTRRAFAVDPQHRPAGSCSRAALAAVFAALAAAFGYVELADFVGGGALFLVYAGIGVLAFRVAFGGALWLALVKSPLAWLRAIERNASRLESAINRMIEVLAIVLWFAFALQRFELLDPALAAVGSVLDARLQAGELNLSVGRVLGFVAVVFGAWLTSRVVVFALEEDVYPRMNLARGVPYALSTLVRYGLLLAGFFAALATLGLDLTRLTVLVSAFGLGLGFGMQQIINNFVSGLILLFERPVQVGDLVQIEGADRRSAAHRHPLEPGPHRRGRRGDHPQLGPDPEPRHQLDALGSQAPRHARRSASPTAPSRARARAAARGRDGAIRA